MVGGGLVEPEGNGEQRGVQVTLVAGGKLLNTLTLPRYHHHHRYQSSPSSLDYLIP